MNPLVSVLTPSLNQVRFVEDCLVSVRRQDYEGIEHIIVDGGSTDGTLEAIERAQNDRCRVISLPGSSQAAALNAALAASRGDVIGWVNTDDGYFGVDAVRCAVKALADDAECIAAYGDGVIVDQRGLVLRHVSTSAAALSSLPAASPLVQPAVFVRRNALEPVFVREDIDVAIDYELWLRLVRRGRFGKVERILAVDRDQPARKTRLGASGQRADLERFAERYGLRPEPSGSPRRIARAWYRRLRGVGELTALDSRYALAFPARTDARWRRLVRQLGLPQRYLHTV